MITRPTLDAFRYVSAVVRLSTFSRAAMDLGVSQPALSNGIARLEEQLGERLFDRSPRGATLTAFGRRVAPLIDRALGAADEITAAARSWGAARSGTIRVGVSPLIDGALVGSVHRGFSGLSLVLIEANMADLQEGLRSGDLDVLLIPSVSPIAGYEHRIIGSEPLVEVEPGAPEASVTDLDVRELAERRLILVPDACGLTAFTRDLFASHGMDLMVYPGEASSYRMLEEWANLGLGASLIPLSKLSSLDAPHRRLRDRDVDVEIFYEMVWDPCSPFAGAAEEVAAERRPGVRPEQNNM